MGTPREEFVKKYGEKAATDVDRTLLEGMATAAAATIRDVLKEEEMDKTIGFTLIMFEFGTGGSLAYVSTAEREQFLQVLDEMRGKLAASLPNTPKGE